MTKTVTIDYDTAMSLVSAISELEWRHNSKATLEKLKLGQSRIMETIRSERQALPQDTVSVCGKLYAYVGVDPDVPPPPPATWWSYPPVKDEP